MTRTLRHKFADRLNALRSAWFFHRLRLRQPLGDRSPGVIRFNGLTVRYSDLASFYVEYKDIFRQGIYAFDAANDRPRIIDGGGCIGMSVLFFKQRYPDARITTFEPDEQLAAMLRQSLSSNDIGDVEVVTSGLAANEGVMRFVAHGSDAGRMLGESERTDAATTAVHTTTLSRYLDEPVDFLKLNIEGQELPVLEQCAEKLRNVSEAVIEYHGWAGHEQRLGKLLELLDDRGFYYLVHDFDRESCAGTKPPFRYRPDCNWECLVYARRVGEATATAPRPRMIRKAA